MDVGAGVNGSSAVGGDTAGAFVMGQGPDEVKVEDTADSEDEDDERPSTPTAIKQWRVDFAAR